MHRAVETASGGTSRGTRRPGDDRCTIRDREVGGLEGPKSGSRHRGVERRGYYLARAAEARDHAAGGEEIRETVYGPRHPRGGDRARVRAVAGEQTTSAGAGDAGDYG